MKRALTALPLLAIALGLAVFLIRRPTTSPEPVRDLSQPEGSATSTTSPALLRPAAPVAPAGSAPAATGAIRFTVTMRGQPAAGARITAQKNGSTDFMKFKTEADGTQFLHGLPSGEYSILIEQEDAIPFQTEFEVAPGQTVVVAADLKVGGRISGTVTDRSGRPIPDTRVFLLDPTAKVPDTASAVVTDDKGRYALKGIPSGDYAMRFRHVQFKPQDRLGLVVRSSSDQYQIDAVLEVGARLAGRVVDEMGAPVEGADLIAGNGDSAGMAKSAADGSFTVTGLTDAPANLSAAKAGYGKIVLRNLSGNPVDLVLRLPKAGTLIGKIRIDIIPAQTHIILSKYDEELRQVVPADSRFFALPTTGTFAFADVPPGTYWVEVQAEGYEAVDRPQVVVAGGQTTPEVSISMRKKN